MASAMHQQRREGCGGYAGNLPGSLQIAWAHSIQSLDHLVRKAGNITISQIARQAYPGVMRQFPQLPVLSLAIRRVGDILHQFLNEIRVGGGRQIERFQKSNGGHLIRAYQLRVGRASARRSFCKTAMSFLVNRSCQNRRNFFAMAFARFEPSCASRSDDTCGNARFGQTSTARCEREGVDDIPPSP